MCGRFALHHPKPTLEEWYQATSIPDFVPRYNIAPASKIITIREIDKGRVGSLMRWGFIPAWAKDPAKMPMRNNARGETVAEKPMFKNAFERRRCIIPVSGFYEWKEVPGQKVKQPFYISFKDGAPMALAGIWESCKMPDGVGILDTCAIITTSPNAVMKPIHDRMPVILDRGSWEAWLSQKCVSPGILQGMIKPFDEERMKAWGVSTAVNRAVNDAPELIIRVNC